MTPTSTELTLAARRCRYAKQWHASGSVSAAMLAVVVADAAALAEAYLAGAELRGAAEEAFGALVGGHAADDSVQGKARARLRAALGYGEGS